MARVSLKNIVGKKNETTTVISNLIDSLKADVWIEDEIGKILLGQQHDSSHSSYPVAIDNETIGFVKGDERAMIIASLLSQLAQKESEKKKLGSEVLNLYQEINLIFNFSEKLAQAIEPAAIAQLALDEATRSIASNRGIVLLWDEETKALSTPAKAGKPIFNETELHKH